MANRRRTILCREGGYYLLVLAVVVGGAMLREVNLLFLLASMFFGPLLVSWRLAVTTLRGLEVRRRAPQGICAGDLLIVDLDVTNPRKRLGSWAVVVEEQVRREGDNGQDPPMRPAVYFSYVPAGRSRARGYSGRMPRRGRYRLGPLKVSTRFPFGLFRHTRTLGQAATLTVFPRLGRLREGWLARHQEAGQGGQLGQRRPGRMSGEFYGVREWRTGDSLRWIHWRSSARHGGLVARQFEQHRNRDVAILVDLWQPDSPNAEQLENVELAVSFAATVISTVCRHGGCKLLVGMTGAEPECVGGPTSNPLLEHVMEKLAVAQASSQAQLPELLELALGQTGPGSDALLISTRRLDSGDRQRFSAAWRDRSRGTAAGRLRVVSTATDELADYFQPE